jgi:type II secretory pathway component PulF
MNDFFSRWYELGQQGPLSFGQFSEDMYYVNDGTLYPTIGLCMVLIPIVVLAIYYYAVNSVKVSRWWHWLLLVVVLCAVNFGIAYSTSYNELAYMYDQLNQDLPYSTQFISFSFVNAFWAFVVSFVWSMIIKWGSKNLRRTPF